MVNRFLCIVSVLAALFIQPSFAQNNNARLGMGYIIKEDFVNAIKQLEKADAKNPDNIPILRLLGYSYYQNKNYAKAIDVYSHIISLKNTEADAYYYRGKARLFLANDTQDADNSSRNNYYQDAIADFTSSLNYGGDSDIKSLQNRALAYKDYGIYRSYQTKGRAGKLEATNLLKKGLADCNKILTMQPNRKDIISQSDYIKRQIASLK